MLSILKLLGYDNYRQTGQTRLVGVECVVIRFICLCCICILFLYGFRLTVWPGKRGAWLLVDQQGTDHMAHILVWSCLRVRTCLTSSIRHDTGLRALQRSITVFTSRVCTVRKHDMTHTWTPDRNKKIYIKYTHSSNIHESTNPLAAVGCTK